MKETELRKLLNDLTLEEKIGQLVQLPGYFQQEGLATGPAGDMGLTQDDLRLAGSYLSIIGAEKIRKLQTEFMARHPHHIPLLFMADIINGYRTVFPIPLAQGCTFDPELADLTGIGVSDIGPLYISRVLHKTHLAVDEEGTKAAAATVVEMTEGAMEMEEPPKEVILDRPFLYLIVDTENNVPMFLGTVMSLG